MVDLKIIQPEVSNEKIEISRENYDHHNKEDLKFKAEPGISEELVRQISKDKGEPEWMLQKRLTGLKIFLEKSTPTWGPNLSDLDLNNIIYYMKPNAKKNSRNWEDVPEDIRKTYERLGIPQAEQKALGGVGAQYESEIVYHNLKRNLEEQGVVFLDMDQALIEYPELVKKYFMTTCIPINLHKFSALHAAVWSGGTFIYIPKGVKVDIPLQAYFRMNAKKGGQFEHTLIIADENSEIHYIEGCFTKGNIISTKLGYKPIENVEINDEILTSEGVYKKVKDIQIKPYSGVIYQVKVYGDSTQTIEVTEDHPFLYVDKKYKNERNKVFNPRWNTPNFFKKGDYLIVPINNKFETKEFHEFEIIKGAGKNGYKNKKIKVPLINEFFRLIGYYLAEGSITKDSYLNFSFNIKEKEYIEDVKYCLKKVFNINKISEFYHKKNNGVSIVVSSVELARIFKQLGTKSDKKLLIDWMINETKEHQKEIIKCWFRGDGNYYNKRSKKSNDLKEVFRINTTSEKLVRQGRDILLRLEVVPFINKRDRSKENRKIMYTLGITGEQMVKFSDIVNIKISEKLNNKNRASMFGINKKFAFVPIKKITKKLIENIPVFNFSVEDHETYTVGGVAVHNCSAPMYSENSLHAGGVEIHVLKNARVRYSSIENWSKNTYNLNTKRAIVHENGIIEWVNGNLGSKITMLYPCSVLLGKNSKSDYIGIQFAGKGQYQDTGCKVYHYAPNTSSTILSKGISKNGGVASYRGLIHVKKNCKGVNSIVRCDGLMLDNISKAITFPSMEVEENDVKVAHEAAVGKVGEEQLFYLMSRGLSEEEATNMIVSGFIEPIIKELPLEYAVELNRLIELEIENSVC